MKNESNKNVSKKEYTNTGNNAYPERDMRLEFCMKFILTFLDTHLVCVTFITLFVRTQNTRFYQQKNDERGG